MNDDGQLIDEALSGNPAAFGRLVTRYQDRLYNTLARLVGSADTAQDLAQDAFVQAYLKLNTFERASGFYTWLYRIAANLAISRQRREKPTVSMDAVRATSGFEPADRSDMPGGRLEQQEQAQGVQRALAALAPEHREILVLREVDDCSYEQIAAMLDLPVGTIRSRLHRARLQMRDELKRVFDEPAELARKQT